MKNKLLNLLYLIGTILFIIWIFYTIGYTESRKKYETNLSIYTPAEIYHIQGLTVVIESNDSIYTFKDKVSLSKYIESATAVSSQVGFDCLNNL